MYKTGLLEHVLCFVDFLYFPMHGHAHDVLTPMTTLEFEKCVLIF